MPLNHSKSNKAFKKNVSTLMSEVGTSPHVKDRKQALAIAYSIKRGKAEGGTVSEEARSKGLDALRRKMGGAYWYEEGSSSPKGFAPTYSKYRGMNDASIISNAVPRRDRAFGGGVGQVAGMNMAPAPTPVTPNLGQALGGAPIGLGAPGAPPVGQPQNIASTGLPGPMSGSPIGIAGPQPQMPMGMPPQNLMMPQQMGFKKGGAVPRLASGGLGGFDVGHKPHLTKGFAQNAVAKNIRSGLTNGMTKGAILSAVPGRTDAHKTHVPSGSYVIPADIVSGRGQGNTIAGAAALHKLFKMGPYGAGSPELKRGPGAPRGPAKASTFKAEGGALDGQDETPVRVNLAGGEIVVPPTSLLAAVHPDLKTAHEIMDQWVLDERKLLRKTLAKLPGPVKE